MHQSKEQDLYYVIDGEISFGKGNLISYEDGIDSALWVFPFKASGVHPNNVFATYKEASDFAIKFCKERMHTYQLKLNYITMFGKNDE